MPAILILDDRPADRELMTTLLAHKGHRVIEAENADQALQLARAERPDLVITDIVMPCTNGYEFVRLLRQQHENANTPVVFCTANYAEGEVRTLAHAVGVQHFLEKPYTLDRMTAVVGEVLGSSPNLAAASPPTGDFDRQQLRVLNDKLVEKVDELEAANNQRRQLLGQLSQTHEQERVARQREQRIRSILASDSLAMVFQPVFDLQRGHPVCFEALARFELEPQRPPNVWFQEAAEAGLGVELELKAARCALAHLDDLPADASLAVNVGPHTAQSLEFLDLVRRAEPTRIVIEITEHERIEDYEAFAAHMAALRTAGARIAVDDAGAGFASLQHILRLDADAIKLDRDLIRDIHVDRRRQALAAALISFAAKLDTEVIAEGIETKAEMDMLRSLGITRGQGYYLARPAPLHRPAPPIGSESAYRPARMSSTRS